MSGDKPTEGPAPESESGENEIYLRRLPPRAWLIALGTLTVGLFAGFSIASQSVPPAPLPEASPSTQAPTANTIPGTGTFWVGPDVTPGLYHSFQNDECEWERARDASGESRAVIARDQSSGDAYVHLKKGEFFDTTGCTKWRRVTNTE
ncbi:hypothetical protein [Streptomyces sp. cg35]|uniref:hypothetical protein n=1 Tax=Streptomyces sp. cg35 TaxID=3421650 RepID=UPI003D186EBB